MTLPVSAVSANDPQFDPASAPKQSPQPTEEQVVAQLAIQGNSAQQIALSVGLPESLVEIELGTTSSSSASPASQASALLALGARLSVQA